MLESKKVLIFDSREDYRNYFWIRGSTHNTHENHKIENERVINVQKLDYSQSSAEY